MRAGEGIVQEIAYPGVLGHLKDREHRLEWAGNSLPHFAYGTHVAGIVVMKNALLPAPHFLWVVGILAYGIEKRLKRPKTHRMLILGHEKQVTSPVFYDPTGARINA